jgi:bifunctional DNA-binding transcriptional regulator/antitoxin component of YhaV-PrlF toxin-antitoxin module
MVRTFITSKGQTTVPVEFRRAWKSDEILWEKCDDGSVRVRPAPSVMALFGAARSSVPRDPQEKARSRELIGRGDRGK